jgi:hypothetical protein
LMELLSYRDARKEPEGQETRGLVEGLGVGSPGLPSCSSLASLELRQTSLRRALP